MSTLSTASSSSSSAMKSAQVDSAIKASVPLPAASTMGIGSSSTIAPATISSSAASASVAIVNVSSAPTAVSSSSASSALASSSSLANASTVSVSSLTLTSLSSSSASELARVSSSASIASSSSSSSISANTVALINTSSAPLGQLFSTEDLGPTGVRPSIIRRIFSAIYSLLSKGWHTIISIVIWPWETVRRFVTCFFMLSDNQRLEKFTEEVLRLTPQQISVQSSELNSQMDELIGAIRSTDELLNLFRFASENIFKTGNVSKVTEKEISSNKLTFAMKILWEIDKLTQNDWQRIEEKLTLSESLELLKLINIEINKQDGLCRLHIKPLPHVSSPSTSTAPVSSSSISSAAFSTSGFEADNAFYSLVDVTIKRVVNKDDISLFLDFSEKLLNTIKSESVRKNWLDAILGKNLQPEQSNRFLNLFFNLMEPLNGKSLKNWTLAIIKKSFFTDAQKDRLLGIVQKGNFEPNDLEDLVREFLNNSRLSFNDKQFDILYSLASLNNNETLVKAVMEKATTAQKITCAQKALSKAPDDKNLLLSTMQLISSRSKNELLAFIKVQKPEVTDALINEARNNSLITKEEARLLAEFNTDRKIAQAKESLRKAPDDTNLLLSTMRLIGSKSKADLITFIKEKDPALMRNFINVIRKNGLITEKEWRDLVELFYSDALDRYNQALLEEAGKSFKPGVLGYIITPSQEAILKQANFDEDKQNQIRMKAYESLANYSKA